MKYFRFGQALRREMAPQPGFFIKTASAARHEVLAASRVVGFTIDAEGTSLSRARHDPGALAPGLEARLAAFRR